MTAVETRPAEGTVVESPAPLLAGTFALYEEPSGAMVIAYRLDNGQEGQRRIPKAVVKAGMRMAKREMGEAGGLD